MKLCLPFSLVVRFFFRAFACHLVGWETRGFFMPHWGPDSIGHGRWKPGCAARSFFFRETLDYPFALPCGFCFICRPLVDRLDMWRHLPSGQGPYGR